MALKHRMVKNMLGDLPLTAEVYWHLIQRGKPLTKSFSLRRLGKNLPTWCEEAERAYGLIQLHSESSKRIFIFTTLRYWIEHGALIGVALAGRGHQVTLAYLPFPNFQRPLPKFDLRRHNAYARSIMKRASKTITPLSLIDIRVPRSNTLPASLERAISEVSLRDTQYCLQVEEVEVDQPKSTSGKLFRLRQHRNRFAASAFLTWFNSIDPAQQPEIVLTPNGSILEMGAIYQAARFLDIPAVTYEFGEQRGRIWLAQNLEVMLQHTDGLWKKFEDIPLSEAQWEQIRSLYHSRQNGKLWENFARLWQGSASLGGERVRMELNLDSRPIALLAANVIGDSLTLGRQIFSKNMTEWLERTVQFFAQRQDVQLVVRIHPGERYLKGPSVAEVVRHVLPELPKSIRLVEAQDPINTYDLVEIADLGLAYTTTVGMEMAMSGVPVVLGGDTHYRSKGFTFNPVSWQEYFETIDQILQDKRLHRLTRDQVEQAWNYAYRFFFEYPQPFPWHLLDFWEELEDWPIERVLSSEGWDRFGATFDSLLGAPMNWMTAESVSN